jgi:hypothetical protein
MSLILSGSDGLSDIDGTAATPAIRGTDTNTGIFFPAADTIAFSEGGTEAMRIDSNGNVGIGTASPGSQKLHIRGTTTEPMVRAISVSPTGNGIYGQYNAKYDGTASDWYFGQGSTGAWSFWNNDGSVSERMRITSDGNLLVGLTAPLAGERLSLYGNSTTSQPALVCDKSAAGAVGCNQILFNNNNGFVGSVTTSGSTTGYNTSSDYRLKENIAPMTGALTTVSLLKPVTYKWKVDGSDGQGFIAHELAEVVPDAVTGEKDAVETYTDEDGNEQTRIKAQGIDTSYLVATLTAAIQELKATVDAQAARIAALEAAP